MSGLKDSAVITGIAETPVGKVPDLTCTQLYADATLDAIADAGIAPEDVDGLISGNSRFEPFLYHADMLSEYLGIQPAHAVTLNTGGSTTGQALAHAATLISSGQCRHVVVVMADKLATGIDRSAVIESMATIGHPRYEAPFGPSIPALYALLGQRYQWECGVTPEQIAEVAVVDRYHASLGERAQYREPITVEDVLGSRLIADPLHLLECAPVSDAGAAIVVSAVDSGAGAHPLVSLMGLGEGRRFEHVSQAASLTETAAVESGRAAFAMAGVAPEDIDVAMVYDAFTFIQCMQLEDLGFCAKGEGGAFVADGNTRLGGRLPVNTNGGVLSHSHAGRPSGLLLITEAVAQLRGEAGGAQVADAELALVHTEGGILASHCTLILGRR
jgi:acetyl-CoA acetyltransferase